MMFDSNSTIIFSVMIIILLTLITKFKKDINELRRVTTEIIGIVSLIATKKDINNEKLLVLHRIAKSYSKYSRG